MASGRGDVGNRRGDCAGLLVAVAGSQPVAPLMWMQAALSGVTAAIGYGLGTSPDGSPGQRVTGWDLGRVVPRPRGAWPDRLHRGWHRWARSSWWWGRPGRGCAIALRPSSFEEPVSELRARQVVEVCGETAPRIERRRPDATPPVAGHRHRELAVPRLARVRLATPRRVRGRRHRRDAGRRGGGGPGRPVGAGADVVTDGEQTRLDFNLSFYGFLDGIEPAEPPSRRFGPPAHDQRGRHHISGRLGLEQGLGVVDEFTRLQRHRLRPMSRSR